jgi:hypothetical protein
MYLKKLEVSNSHNEISNIEKISFSNFYEKKFFEDRKPYKAFEDSWFALIQGIRDNPRIYKRKIYFSDHPYKPNSIVVYNHLCRNIPEFSNLLSALIDELGKTTAVWKNADPKDLISLLHSGFKCYEENERWNPTSQYDDQTFGQYICPLKSIALLEGATFAQIRQQTRAVERIYKNELLFEIYRRKYKNECERLTLSISKEIGNGKSLNITDIECANLLYLSYPPNNSFIVHNKEKILSFIAFDVREKIANFNCLIYQRNPKYISTYTMVKAAQELYRRGVSMVNLSGSEFKSLDNWKNKFNPAYKIERTHVVLSNK